MLKRSCVTYGEGVHVSNRIQLQTDTNNRTSPLYIKI